MAGDKSEGACARSRNPNVSSVIARNDLCPFFMPSVPLFPLLIPVELGLFTLVSVPSSLALPISQHHSQPDLSPRHHPLPYTLFSDDDHV